MESRLKQTILRLAAVSFALAALQVALLCPGALWAQGPAAATDPLPNGQVSAREDAGPPPSSGGIFPLSQVRRGMTGTAWTVFSGSKPEAMEVEILGVLRGARGPGQDMILAQLHGAKPEYTGVVEGMSGSPVYIGNKLLGALSYRIGQFSKEPIAGITPIEQMLEVGTCRSYELPDQDSQQEQRLARRTRPGSRGEQAALTGGVQPRRR